MFRFREIHEVKEEEKINNKQNSAWMNIKPESDMSFDDCEDFWAQEFRKAALDAED